MVNVDAKHFVSFLHEHKTVYAILSNIRESVKEPELFFPFWYHTWVEDGAGAAAAGPGQRVQAVCALRKQHDT